MASKPQTTKSRYSHTRKRKSNPIYRTKSWTAYSKQYLLDNPLCNCGCGKISEHVDHYIRIKIGGSYADPRNHQALNSSCHGKKTKKELQGYTYEYIETPNGRIPKHPLRWIKYK